jgi:N-acetylmuramoyl-L-alanine amidase
MRLWQGTLLQNHSGRLRAGALILLGAWLGLWSAIASAAEPPIASATQLVGDETRTRFIAELSYAVSYSVYVMPDPYRVIIDLPEISFQLPAGSGADSLGLISEYRYGTIGEGKSRIVIDTDGPVLIARSFIMKPEGESPARIVVDLVKTDEVNFNKIHAAEPDGTAGSELPFPPPSTLPKPQPQPAAAKDIVKPEPKPANSQHAEGIKPPKPARREDGRRVIVIDPGHGGIDPGAVGIDRIREKDVVLAFGEALRNSLKASGKYEVVMTRDGDRFVSLRDRVRAAREHQADLFVAIHADTLRGRGARGATIYTLSDKASDAEAEALAQKENRADIIAGVNLAAENEEVADILIDLAQRETKYHSLTFARKAVGQLKPVTQMTGRPMRSAGFVVLKAPDVPSILLELGYLSSRADAKLLTSPKWQKQVAVALAKAIDGYFSTEIAATR